MLIGYARVSTFEQNLELQIDALNLAGCEQIFVDKVSSTKENRQQLIEMEKILRKGDVVVVWKLDRIGRSVKNLVEIINDYNEKGINFKTLTQPIDTTTTDGKLMFHILAAFAEFERDMIKERTLAGMHAARARGIKGGRPQKLNPEQKALLLKMHEDRTISIKTICDTLKIAKPTLYKILREEKAKRDLISKNL